MKTAIESSLDQVPVLENDHLQVVFSSATGKIHSIKSKASRKEWLWTNPSMAPETPSYETSFVERLDSGGWDEILPSVEPDVVTLSGGDSIKIPDHGDLVRLPWFIESQDTYRLRASVQGRCLPFVFEREWSLDGSRLNLAYRIQNQGNEMIPYMWCAHPIFAIESGMRLSFGTGGNFKVAASLGDTPLNAGDSFDWPGPKGAGRSLETVPDPRDERFSPFALKLFSRPGEVDCAVLEDVENQERLTMKWDSQDVPSLGVWMNYGCWSGCGSKPYFNMVLEPSTAPCDKLSEAQENGFAQWLEPFATARWNISVSIESLSENR